MGMKINSSHDALCREFAYENTIDKLQNNKEDTSLCNLWFKVVCSSYTSLAMHGNVIDENKIIGEL